MIATIPERGDRNVKLADAITALIAIKREVGCREKYVVSLRGYLARFAKGREHSPLRAVADVSTVERWLAQSVVVETRLTNRNRLSALFSYSVRRKWIDENPCGQLESVRIERREPLILNPHEAAVLLDWARRRKHPLGFFALGLTTGVRPEEMSRLGWEKINLDDKTIVINASSSKVRQRRVIRLDDTAVAWLRLAKEYKSRLPVSQSTRVRYIRQARDVLGVKEWPQDVLRHSFASYMVAKTQNVDATALGMGSSPKVLFRHYLALASQKEADQFWNFLPDSPAPARLPHSHPEPPTYDAVPVPESWGVYIDPAWNRFVRVEKALQVEPEIRKLARRRQRAAAYHGGTTGERMPGEAINTIRTLAKLAGCSRQNVRYVKQILKLADPDILDKLRQGKLSIWGVFKRLVKETQAPTTAEHNAAKVGGL